MRALHLTSTIIFVEQSALNGGGELSGWGLGKGTSCAVAGSTCKTFYKGQEDSGMMQEKVPGALLSDEWCWLNKGSRKRITPEIDLAPFQPNVSLVKSRLR